MKIDRHNYEEFFLLYIDNELNVDQKKQVEAFVLANPDLEEELVMLQQTKLVADDSIVFEAKESLVKDTAINLHNYEEWLLLYVDNELAVDQKLSVESFAAAHPQVQQELDLFLQTRLEAAELISFGDKTSLYRREEKVRVISMSWWRVAVAAVLVLAAGVGTYSIFNNSKPPAGIAGKTNQSLPANQQPNSVVKRPAAEAVKPNVEVDPAANKNLATESTTIKTGKKNSPVHAEGNADNSKLLATIDPVEVKTDAPAEGQKQLSHATSADAFMTNSPQQQQSINNPAVTKDIAQAPNIKLASDKTSVDPGADDDGENKRLRGFFRKATRFIERTTKVNPANDDNKVLIGAMAVSLK